MSATLSVADAAGWEGTGATSLVMFTVTLSEASSQPVAVDFATADGTASRKNDYTAVAGTLTFAPGETVKVVSVELSADSRDESNETFQLLLSGAVNAGIADGLGVGSIYDDDASRSGDGGGHGGGGGGYCHPRDHRGGLC